MPGARYPSFGFQVGMLSTLTQALTISQSSAAASLVVSQGGAGMCAVFTKGVGSSPVDNPVVYLHDSNAADTDTTLEIKNEGLGNAVSINESNASSTADGILVTNAGTGSGLFVEQDGVLGANQSGVRVYSNAAQVTDALMYVQQDNAASSTSMVVFNNDGTGSATNIQQNGVLSGGSNALLVYSNAVQISSPLVFIHEDNAGSTVDTVLVRNDSTGKGMRINQQGNGVGLHIDSTSTVIAPLRLPNLVADPTGAALVGDLAVVGGKLKICTVAGTPGTWTVVGSQS